MSNTTQKTEQELANESFDKRMKKEAYKGKEAKRIFEMFKKALMKYSCNSMKCSPLYLSQLLAKNTNELNSFDIGVMLNLIRGAAFEMVGVTDLPNLVDTFELMDNEYKNFNEVAQQCWKAAEKEAKSKIKVAKK